MAGLIALALACVGNPEPQHHVLRLDVPEARVAELRRLVGAAEPALAEALGASWPETPLALWITRDPQAWSKWTYARGLGETWAWTSARTGETGVFLPAGAYGDQLVLHELAHGLRFRARTGGQSGADWYEEGLAEHLALHDWDGRRLVLGADRDPEDRLGDARGRPVTLEEWIADDAFPDIAMQTAFVRFLAQDAARFRRFCDAVDAQAPSDWGAEVESVYGPLSSLESAFVSWLG